MPTAVETIIFTAVPNGITSAGNLRISIHVAPQLSKGSTGTLQDFPDFQDWPAAITPHNGQSATRLGVRFTNPGGTVIGTAAVPIPTAQLSSSLWRALFNPPGTSPPGSSVEYRPRDAAEPYTRVPVVSYPASAVASYLQDTYTQVALGSPTEYPTVDTLSKHYGGLGYVGRGGLERLNGLYRQLAIQRTTSQTGAVGAPYYNDWTGVSPATALAALRFYHMPPVRFQPGYAPFPKPTLPLVDFHRALTFIGQHRALQRALGLVFDIELSPANLSFISAVLRSDVYVQAFPVTDAGAPGFTPSTGVTFTPVLPRTQCDASTTVFEAHPRSAQIVGRQLKLGDTSAFGVHEIDIDGGGLKNASFADSLSLASQPQRSPMPHDFAPKAAPDAPGSYALPALRSAGLTVTAFNRGKDLVDGLNRSSDLIAGMPSSVPDLTADDLVQGFVLDVFDQTGRTWHSTAMRDVTYAATGVSPSLSLTDEAPTDAPPRAQTCPTSPSTNQLNLSEIFLRWNGWSNAAPRPGKAIQDDGTTNPPAGSQAGPFSQLTITTNVTAGSLPKLRYGETYNVRARIVDIAGNVIALDAGANPGDPAVSPPIAFTRHEPVGSPDVYNPDETPLPGPSPVPGEVLKRLVIRDIDPVSSVRYFAPNKIAESFAELHGEFDVASGTGKSPDPAAYATIVNREGQLFDTTAVLSKAVPYLPDPLSRGGVLKVIDGTLAGHTVPFDFSPASGGNWPDYRPFSLKLTAGAGQAATVDSASRQVQFTLARADIVNLRLSSTCAATDLPTLGIYNWVSRLGPVPATFKSAALTGLCWALTPYTQLELVFAVRQPLFAPKITNQAAFRQLGWTYAELFGDITYSPKSTNKTDLHARWTEPVDNGTGSGMPQGAPVSAPVPRQSAVFTIPSLQNQQFSRLDRFSGKHEFHDTKHRFVDYHGHAPSRFTEFYQGTIAVHAPAAGTTIDLHLPGSPNLGVEPGSVAVTSKDGKTTYALGTDYQVSPAPAPTGYPTPAGAGKVKFLNSLPGDIVVSFQPIVSRDTAEFKLNILSSARPATVEIPFVVPIYKWSKVTHSGKKTLSRRTPSALRVFIERPWWSSGEGELLGVLTWPTAEKLFSSPFLPTTPMPDNVSHFVTDWGADPVFGSQELPFPHPRLKSFPNAVHYGHGLSIAERPGLSVNVAGHPVGYDADRDLWYCDIRVDVGKSYTPMIRLALARYQPDSLRDAELSRVVLADIMSLEPGRIALVQRANPGLLSQVTVAGYSYFKAAAGAGLAPGLAELVVERRNPDIHDEVLGWEPVSEVIQMQSGTGPGGITTWTARQIKVPPTGRHRLAISQYEVLPQDNRSHNIYALAFQRRGLRLVYHDQIPI